MSTLDYRKVEKVSCAGISISTFLSDCRNFVLVSASDLIDNLGLNVSVDDIDCSEYITYDLGGRQVTHYCIMHTDVNDLLFMYDCTPTNVDNLVEFRKYFMYEVISFWNRFAPAAASLSSRDAVKVIDVRNSESFESLFTPRGRIYEHLTESLGYKSVPNKEDLTTEELAFIAMGEMLYASVLSSESYLGVSEGEAISTANRALSEPLWSLGSAIRELV